MWTLWDLNMRKKLDSLIHVLTCALGCLYSPIYTFSGSSLYQRCEFAPWLAVVIGTGYRIFFFLSLSLFLESWLTGTAVKLMTLASLARGANQLWRAEITQATNHKKKQNWKMAFGEIIFLRAYPNWDLHLAAYIKFLML